MTTNRRTKKTSTKTSAKKAKRAELTIVAYLDPEYYQSDLSMETLQDAIKELSYHVTELIEVKLKLPAQEARVINYLEFF